MASSTDPSKVKLFSLCPWERCPSCSQLLWGSSCQLPLLPPFPQEAGCPWGLVQRDLAAAEERGGEDVPPKEPPPRVTQHLAAHLWDTSGCSPSPQSLLEGGTCSKVRDFWGWEGWEQRAHLGGRVRGSRCCGDSCSAPKRASLTGNVSFPCVIWPCPPQELGWETSREGGMFWD